MQGIAPWKCFSPDGPAEAVRGLSCPVEDGTTSHLDALQVPTCSVVMFTAACQKRYAAVSLSAMIGSDLRS